MKKVIHDLLVVKNERLNPGHYLLELKAPEKLGEVLPGQFAEVLIENSRTTFLRRPFSIHNVDNIRNTISLYIKEVGDGSRRLGHIKEGDTLNLVYPLGNSFSLPIEGSILLVGGGCGLAPLLLLARTARRYGLFPVMLIGAKSRKDLFELGNFRQYGDVFISTEDGSYGERGLVTDLPLFKNLNGFEKVYACGPEPMMKEVARIVAKTSLECEVSLENTMACGIGVCLCCVVETVNGNRCVCTEGPVFNTKQLKWQI